MDRKCLPFPRGETISQNSKLSMDATVFDNLVGQIFETEDTEHGTGTIVKLRVVRAGAALTVARKFVDWGTDALDFGNEVDDLAPTAGDPTKPLDDMLTVGATIVQYDLFYVVEAGPCSVLTGAVGVNLAAHAAVATDATGCVQAAAATAGQSVVGTIDAATTDEDTEVVVWVTEGLNRAPAAG